MALNPFKQQQFGTAGVEGVNRSGSSGVWSVSIVFRVC